MCNSSYYDDVIRIMKHSESSLLSTCIDRIFILLIVYIVTVFWVLLLVTLISSGEKRYHILFLYYHLCSDLMPIFLISILPFKSFPWQNASNRMNTQRSFLGALSLLLCWSIFRKSLKLKSRILKGCDDVNIESNLKRTAGKTTLRNRCIILK